MGTMTVSERVRIMLKMLPFQSAGVFPTWAAMPETSWLRESKSPVRLLVMPLMSSSLSQLLMASSRKSMAYLLVGLPVQTGRRNMEHTHPSKPESSGIRVVPMRATPPPAMSCFIPN